MCASASFEIMFRRNRNQKVYPRMLSWDYSSDTKLGRCRSITIVFLDTRRTMMETLSLSLLRQQSSKGYTESTLKGQVIGIFATALWLMEYLPGQEKRNGFQAPFIRFYQMRSTSVMPFFRRPLPRTYLKRKGKSIMDLHHSTMWKTATKPLFQETFL